MISKYCLFALLAAVCIVGCHSLEIFAAEDEQPSDEALSSNKRDVDDHDHNEDSDNQSGDSENRGDENNSSSGESRNRDGEDHARTRRSDERLRKVVFGSSDDKDDQSEQKDGN